MENLLIQTVDKQQNQTMQSVVVKQPHHLAIEQRTIPQPSAHEVRIEVRSAGICGSDLHIYKGHNPFALYPRVIGHEFFGIVDAIGSACHNRRIGERVAIDPVVSCGTCYPCSISRPNVCTQLQVIGVHLDGGFSEYVCVPEQNAYPLPDTIPDKLACMVEPFSVAANITAQLNLQKNDIALVYGCGPLGLTVIQMLSNIYRVQQIIVTDQIDERLTMAKDNGAHVGILNYQSQLTDYFQAQPFSPTVIIDAACHSSILQQAIHLASPAARIGIMGFSSTPSEITQQSITSKEISLYSSRLNSHRFPEVIELMHKGLLHPEKLITHYFEITKVVEALHIFETNQRSCCKIVLNIDTAHF